MNIFKKLIKKIKPFVGELFDGGRLDGKVEKPEPDPFNPIPVPPPVKPREEDK